MDAMPGDKKKDNKYGQNGKYSDWEIEDMARDLVRAEKIKGDKDKMQFVKKCMMEDCEAMENAVESLDDLREMYDKKSKEEGGY